MRPWQTATRKQIAGWIRDAAMCMWLEDNHKNWIDIRMIDGWSEEDSREFLKQFHRKISSAKTELDRWGSGEGHFTA